VSGFAGFGERAFDFFAGLQADNSKAYWTDNVAAYENDVKTPMLALLAVLEAEFGRGSMFRPYRDVRFSKDKSPYKTAAGATVGRYYLQLDADGLLLAGGYYEMASDQRDRYRRAVDDDVAGTALVRLVDVLAADGWEFGGDPLKTRPRGYDVEHPRIELLRFRSAHAWRALPAAEWMHTPESTDRISAGFRQLTGLVDWLLSNVGASTAPPDTRRR
jgi:uncharacterized protein (TIGR02453 family)